MTESLQLQLEALSTGQDLAKYEEFVATLESSMQRYRSTEQLRTTRNIALAGIRAIKNGWENPLEDAVGDIVVAFVTQEKIQNAFPNLQPEQVDQLITRIEKFEQMYGFNKDWSEARIYLMVQKKLNQSK